MIGRRHSVALIASVSLLLSALLTALGGAAPAGAATGPGRPGGPTTTSSPAAGTVRSGPVLIRTVRTRVKGAPATTVAVTYLRRNTYVKRSLETGVAAIAAQGLAHFNDVYGGPHPGLVGSYRMTGRLVANGGGVLAMQFSEEQEFLGAHPMQYFHAIVLDSRTGRVWSQSEIARRLRWSARPGVDLLSEIKRAIAPDGSARELTLDGVTLIPTSSGLRILVDRCVLVCAAGTPTGVIPWSRLLDPAVEVPFVPALWRR